MSIHFQYFISFIFNILIFEFLFLYNIKYSLLNNEQNFSHKKIGMKIYLQKKVREINFIYYCYDVYLFTD